MLRFNDGMEFDTSGELRITRRRDGLYVIGEGVLIPVETREEARELIAELKWGRFSRKNLKEVRQCDK